jgi:hypothetical protein
MSIGPYETGKNPNHPGVRGEPYNRQPLIPGVNVKVDNPGTGTFPPHAQGVEGQAQPAGLSATRDYGEVEGIAESHPLSNEGRRLAGMSPVQELEQADAEGKPEEEQGEEGHSNQGD